MRKMRLFWNKLVFTLTNRKQESVELGGFIWTFRKYSMEVRSLSENFKMRLLCGEHAYGYLMTALRHDKKENLEGYALIMYTLAVSLTRDQKLVSDVTRDIKMYASRLERQAEKEAKRSKNEDDNEILVAERMAEENARKLNKKVKENDKRADKK